MDTNSNLLYEQAQKLENNANILSHLPQYGYSIQKKCTPSPIHNLQYVELPTEYGFAFRIVSDVSLLFNQKRLANTIGVDEAKAWLTSLNHESSENLGAKFSDDQLISLVKSRHVQSPSDLRSWSNFLTDQAKSIQDFVELNSKYNSKNTEYETNS